MPRAANAAARRWNRRVIWGERKTIRTRAAVVHLHASAGPTCAHAAAPTSQTPLTHPLGPCSSGPRGPRRGRRPVPRAGPCHSPRPAARNRVPNKEPHPTNHQKGTNKLVSCRSGRECQSVARPTSRTGSAAWPPLPGPRHCARASTTAPAAAVVPRPTQRTGYLRAGGTPDVTGPSELGAFCGSAAITTRAAATGRRVEVAGARAARSSAGEEATNAMTGGGGCHETVKPEWRL